MSRTKNATQDNRFFELVKDYLTVYIPRNRCLSEHTRKSYKDTLNLLRVYLHDVKHLSFAEICFEMFDHSVVYSFLEWLRDERNCCAATCNQRLAALKSFFKYCAMVDVGLVGTYLDINDIAKLRGSHKAGIEYLTRSALDAVFDQPDTKSKQGIRNLFFMVFLYDTGARVAEALNVKMGDIHKQATTTCVYLTGKGNKTRAVPLMEETCAHLEKYAGRYHDNNESDFLFYTVIKGDSGAMSDDTPRRFMKQYAKTAHVTCSDVPLNLHPHHFRHSRAMHLYQAGVPLSYIKDFLGHRCIDTTGVYASADVGILRDALEKVASQDSSIKAKPMWKEDEETLLKLCGLR
jgi:site-specific recombinase XerD